MQDSCKLAKFEFPTDRTMFAQDRSKPPKVNLIINKTSPYLNRTLLMDPALKRRLMKQQKRGSRQKTMTEGQFTEEMMALPDDAAIVSEEPETGVSAPQTKADLVTMRLFPQPVKCSLEDSSSGSGSGSGYDEIKRLKTMTQLPPNSSRQVQRRVTKDRTRFIHIHRKFNTMVQQRRSVKQGIQDLLPSRSDNDSPPRQS